MTEPNQNQTDQASVDTTSPVDPNPAEPLIAEALEQSNEESTNKKFLGIPMPLLLAIATGFFGTALGAGLTSLGEVITSYGEFNAQFRQGRQEFEFELIREVLEVQPIPNKADENQETDESGETDTAISFAQNISSPDQENNESPIDQEDSDSHPAAKELEFYADVGIIRSLNAEKIKEWATERRNELPELSSSDDPSSSSNICFNVLVPSNVYNRPSFDAPLDINFEQGDIAYASYPFNKYVVAGVQNSFVLIDIFGGNQVWVPLYSADLTTKILELYPSECVGQGLHTPTSRQATGGSR